MSPEDEQSNEAPAEDGAEQKTAETEAKVKKKKEAHADDIDKVQAKKKVKLVKKKKPLKPVKKRRTAAKQYTGRDIGIEIERPTKICTDDYCPYHGKLPVRGQIIRGICVSTKMNKTALIQRERRRFNQKYERYDKRTKKFSAHNPECLEIQVGEPVAVMECRPISKTVSFVIIGRP